MRLITLIILLSLFFSGCGAEKETTKAMCPICKNQVKHGCLNSRASNYDSEATIDNNSCEFIGDRGNWSDKQITDTVNQCISNSGESRFVCECVIEQLIHHNSGWLFQRPLVRLLRNGYHSLEAPLEEHLQS